MRSRLRLSAGTYAAFDCFIVAGAIGVYLKLALLGPHWGAVSRFLDLPSPAAVAVSTRLGLFFHDIWINLLAIPFVATLLLLPIRRRWRVAAALVTSGVMSTVYFIELQVQKEVGNYLSRAIVRDLFGWMFATPGALFDYASARSILKLIAVFAALAAIAVVERLCARAERFQQPREARLYRRLLAAPAIVATLSAVVLLPLAAASALSESPLAASSVGRAARLLVRPSEGSGLPAEASVAGTLTAFRQMTHTPLLDTDADYIGRESGSDLILFMMETGSAHALDLATDGRTLPGIGRI